MVDGSQRIAELRASSRSKFGSSVGATLAVIALLNPAGRNTGSHISTPLISQGTHLAGVAGSIYQTIGWMGTETAAFRSFGPGPERLRNQRRGPRTSAAPGPSNARLKHATPP